MGKYDKALGIGSGVDVRTELSIPGAMEWAVSKSPALLGGALASWAYEWANRKWPNHPRGAKFVGGLAVVVAAYGLQVGLGRFMKQWAHMADKITDGMVGRVSGILIDLFRRLLPAKPAAQPYGPPSPDSSQRQLAPEGTAANASLDGDRGAIQDVGGLLQNSPETTQEMADAMFAIMRRDGHEVDEGGREALVKSMREVAQKFAAGNF